ncbi:hypothetical protein [Brevibacterium yomogidense]|nr:hypothetical protein [Brevibacterium yomogidense]
MFEIVEAGSSGAAARTSEGCCQFIGEGGFPCSGEAIDGHPQTVSPL